MNGVSLRVYQVVQLAMNGSGDVEATGHWKSYLLVNCLPIAPSLSNMPGAEAPAAEPEEAPEEPLPSRMLEVPCGNVSGCVTMNTVSSVSCFDSVLWMFCWCSVRGLLNKITKHEAKREEKNGITYSERSSAGDVRGGLGGNGGVAGSHDVCV